MTMTDREPPATDPGTSIESKITLRRSSRTPIVSLLRRQWMLLAAFVIVAVAGFGVYRLHGTFGSHNNNWAANGIQNEIIPFNPKHVVYEVFGPSDAVATINY